MQIKLRKMERDEEVAWGISFNDFPKQLRGISRPGTIKTKEWTVSSVSSIEINNTYKHLFLPSSYTSSDDEVYTRYLPPEQADKEIKELVSAIKSWVKENKKK